MGPMKFPKKKKQFEVKEIRESARLQFPVKSSKVDAETEMISLMTKADRNEFEETERYMRRKRGETLNENNRKYHSVVAILVHAVLIRSLRDHGRSGNV